MVLIVTINDSVGQKLLEFACAKNLEVRGGLEKARMLLSITLLVILLAQVLTGARYDGSYL